MTVTTVKISQEFSYNGNKTWIGLEGTLIEGEDFMEEVKKAKDLVIKSFEQTVRETKSPDLALTEKDISERGVLIQELLEATELKSITIIHNEAPQWMKSDKTFLDEVLKNKLRLTAKK